MGSEACRGFVDVCLGMGDYVSTGGYQLTNAHSLWGAMELLMGGLGTTTVKIFSIILAIGVIGTLATMLRGPIDTQSPRFALQFGALVVGTILLSPHFYFYDLTILALPFTLAFLVLRRDKSRVAMTIKFLMAVIFLGASQFSVVAEATSVQPSLILLTVMLGCLSLVVIRSTNGIDVNQEEPREQIG